VNPALYNQLLQTLGDVGTPSPSEQLEHILGSVTEADPKLQLILQLLARRHTEEEAADDDDLDDDINAPAQPIPPDPYSEQKMRETRQHVQRRIAALQLELRELRERNAYFAKAIGACSHCLGTNQACPNCHGTGRPGTYAVDPALFQLLVAPALTQVQARATPESGGKQSYRPLKETTEVKQVVGKDDDDKQV
jgi:hypothetical protein